MADVAMTFEAKLVENTSAINNGVMDVGGLSSVVLQVTGITPGESLSVVGSIDGVNYVALAMRDLSLTSGAFLTTISVDGLYLVPAAGLSELKVVVDVPLGFTIQVVAKGVFAPGPAMSSA